MVGGQGLGSCLKVKGKEWLRACTEGERAQSRKNPQQENDFHRV